MSLNLKPTLRLHSHQFNKQSQSQSSISPFAIRNPEIISFMNLNAYLGDMDKSKTIYFKGNAMTCPYLLHGRLFQDSKMEMIVSKFVSPTTLLVVSGISDLRQNKGHVNTHTHTHLIFMLITR